jgi:hypothetical protein
LNISSLDGLNTVLETTFNKYVSIDLSGSTFTSIGSEAFFHSRNMCPSLTGVTIGNSVTSIGQGAFYNCYILTEINVASGNNAFSSENGVLYNKNKTTLVCYPHAKTGSFTIPNGVTSIGQSTFNSCTNLASITIPASVTSIGQTAFQNCAKLTSVTFGGSNTGMTKASNLVSFPGDLHIAYQAGGAGTYTRPANGANWTKQGAASAPAPAPAVNTSLDGWWVNGTGMTIVVSGNTATFLYFGTSPLWQSAVNKGYVKSGDQKLRNIRSTGNLTWTMQELGNNYDTRSPNVSTGTGWENTTLTMSADGQTLSENGSVRWTREVPHQ